jgi:hypothetical protein
VQIILSKVDQRIRKVMYYTHTHTHTSQLPITTKHRVHISHSLSRTHTAFHNLPKDDVITTV